MNKNLKKWAALVVIFLTLFSLAAQAQSKSTTTSGTDRIELVTQQINLLKNRLAQVNSEYAKLREQQDNQISELAIQKASKNLLDKAALDISVSKSNLDSITIEYTDAQQNVSWLEKNIQEIENQLNVLNIFGLKFAPNQRVNVNEYKKDIEYQKKLLQLEKARVGYLQSLHVVANNVLQLQNDQYNRLKSLLKTRRTLLIKQQQVQDELAYQELQNHWLQELNTLYAKFNKIDPVKDKQTYTQIERDIFYANENANFAYLQSLVARYKDQIRQMNFAMQKNNSITILNEMRDQSQLLTKQVNRFDSVLKERLSVLNQHIVFFEHKKNSEASKIYVNKLNELRKKYNGSTLSVLKLNENLAGLKSNLDYALQNELSSRQGFPSFGHKAWLDLGKEVLLVPALTFQIVKSLSHHFVENFQTLSMGYWVLFAVGESCILFIFFILRKLLAPHPEDSSQDFNFRWLMREWLNRNFIDLTVVTNMIAVMLFFDVSLQHFSVVVSLTLVWLVFKSINTISHISLIETTHDTTGHDVRLYHRLKWIILVGGIITAFTVFAHQLPLIYELKTLCDRLFLFLVMIVSLMLLRSWDVVPNLILSNMEAKHPYLQKSICLIGILIPLLMFLNAFAGLMGYVNLIISVSRYEGIFLLVLFGYLILRGLLSDGMEQLSRLMIQYVNNGWLLTEAFLKPFDKVLRITLFLSAWAMLFLLYGWDQQSPIVERLMRLLHYELIRVLNTTITPLSIIELCVVISFFYWTAKWTREFVYRLLLSRTQDMGIRNSIALLSQYSVIVIGGFICLRVLGIDLRALAVVFSVFAFGIGWGLRDLANNFVCGFLILLERPLRVGDIVNINDAEGEVIHIGSRAVTVRTWDHMDLVVPNAEIFNKSFTNWTAKDNIVRSVLHVKISRYDNPHEVKVMIQNVLAVHKEVLKDPVPDVYLKEMTDNHMDFELRYHVNIRQVKSRTYVVSSVLMHIWDIFAQHGIKPPHPQQEIFIRNERPKVEFHEEAIKRQ